MKALVYTGLHGMQLRDEPEPATDPHDAMVAVDAAGICGSDMHGYLGRDPKRVPPLIMGHEVAGRALTGRHAGRRVVVNPQVACGACDDCLSGRTNLCLARTSIGVNRAGGFAELMSVPESNLIPMPDGMNPVHAALTEPAATALHAVTLASRAAQRPIAETTALVVGGGSIGLFAALWLKSWGVRALELAETNALRRQAVGGAGIAAIDPGTQLGRPRPVDIVVDAVGGAATRKLALDRVRPGGMIVHVGILDPEGGIDMRRLTLSEVSLIGAFTYTPLELTQTVRALHEGVLGTLDWVDVRPLADGPAAFADIASGRSGAPKIVLAPQTPA